MPSCSWFYYRRSNLAHIAHCAQVAERYGIGLWVHRADLPYLEGPQWPELEALLGARPCPAPEAFVEEGSDFQIAGLELRVLHTPGHTPGGVCFVHEASRTILVGDTLFAGSVGRTDLPGGDWATLERSMRGIWKFATVAEVGDEEAASASMMVAPGTSK